MEASDDDYTSSSSDVEVVDDDVHPENPPDAGGYDSDNTISGVGWRRNQVKLLGVSNAKPVVIQLRNGFTVFLYQIDMSIKSTSSKTCKSQKRSNAGVAEKTVKDWPTEFAFLEDVGFLKALDGNRIRLIDVRTYYLCWFTGKPFPEAGPTSADQVCDDDVALVDVIPPGSELPLLPSTPIPSWVTGARFGADSGPSLPSHSSVGRKQAFDMQLLHPSVVKAMPASSQFASIPGASRVGVGSPSMPKSTISGNPDPAVGPEVPTSGPGTPGSGLVASGTGASRHLSSDTPAPASGSVPVSSNPEIVALRNKMEKMEALLAEKELDTTAGASTPEDKEFLKSA